MSSRNLKYLIAVTSVLILVVLFGCTVTPVHTHATVASFDSGVQNSGLVGYYTNAAVVYRVITPHARDRVNALIEVYGKRFAPPLNRDDGIQQFGTNYIVEPGAWVKALTMARWRRERQ